MTIFNTSPSRPIDPNSAGGHYPTKPDRVTAPSSSSIQKVALPAIPSTPLYPDDIPLPAAIPLKNNDLQMQHHPLIEVEGSASEQNDKKYIRGIIDEEGNYTISTTDDRNERITFSALTDQIKEILNKIGSEGHPRDPRKLQAMIEKYQQAKMGFDSKVSRMVKIIENVPPSDH